MHHFFPIKRDHRKMSEDMNGGKNEGREDETVSMVNT